MRHLQEDYQITIDTFQGPLDLLLYLIRRAEEDILDIPIAAVTEQFLKFLRQLDFIDIDVRYESRHFSQPSVAIPISIELRQSASGSFNDRVEPFRATLMLTCASPDSASCNFVSDHRP